MAHNSKPDLDGEDSDDDGLLGSGGGADLFSEPQGFRPASPPATSEEFVLSSTGLRLEVRLVGHNPLWGHHLWNAGRVLAELVQRHDKDKDDSANGGGGSSGAWVRGKAVLELGAGAGLPSLVAWACGASRVVVTDYPDHDLVENLRLNVDAARSQAAAWVADREGREMPGGEIAVEGYLWGAPLGENMRAEVGVEQEGSGGGCFDLLILGDLLFNHSEHQKLVETVRLALKRSKDSVALVYFTPYRPWLLDKDLAFFNLAKDGGFEVTKVGETVMPEVMFKEDRGDELLRRTVYGYELRWKEVV